MRRPAWMGGRLRVPVPHWIVGLFDPAQAYMERSGPPRPRRRRRRRPARGRAGYAPLASTTRVRFPSGRPVRGSEQQDPVVVPPAAHERLRRRADEHAARAEALLAAHDRLLDDAVGALRRQGATVVTVAAATLSARIVRFRWGDRVLQIDGRPGGDAAVTTSSRTRLGRLDPEQEAATVKRYLAGALADLVPES